MRCKRCSTDIGKREYDKYLGFCKKCVNDNHEFIKAKNETKKRNIKRIFSSHEPFIVNNDDGTPRFICYLPEMAVITETSDENFAFTIEINNEGLERDGNLVGFAGFFFDTEFHWATTPEKMQKAWNWFNQMLKVDDNFWWSIRIDTVRDFLDNNWNTYENEMNDTFIVDILTLIWFLYNLDMLKVDTKAKISEIRKHSKGRIRKFEKLRKKVQFSYDFRFSRNALSRITEIRESLAHLSSEAKLAALAKSYGFHVKLNEPDVIINGKGVAVKKPVERYIPPKNVQGFMVITNESTEIEGLSGLIDDGFRQKADIIAIEVNHLEERPIRGYKAHWHKQTKLKNALTLALGYATKDIVLLFKAAESGYMGSIVKCKKKALNEKG